MYFPNVARAALWPALVDPCPSALGLFFVYIFAQLSSGKKLIRHHEQAQSYVNGGMFYRPYVLSSIPSRHTNHTHVL